MDITINKLPFSIPDTIADVPIGSWLHYQQHLLPNRPERATAAIEWQREVVLALCGWPERFKKDLPHADLVATFSHLFNGGILTWDPTAEGELLPCHSFEFNGITYMAPPPERSLSGVSIPMRHATTEEVLEAMALHEAAAQVQGGELSKLCEILAVLYRPAGEAYDDKTVVARAELFRELPAPLACSAYFFLFRRFVTSMLTPSTAGSSKPEAKAPKKAAATPKRWATGAGMPHWLRWRAALANWRKSKKPTSGNS